MEQLIDLKRRGFPIANKNPESLRVSTQAQHAHEGRALCAALTTLQFQANGDVTVCAGTPTVGNVKAAPIREIWERRPCWWKSGC